MKIKKIILMVLIPCLSLFAQTELSKVGTSMGQFLKLGAGARGTALGDAYTSVTKDVTAMYWNPAGIQKIGHRAVAFSRTQLFAGISYDFLGLVIPINRSTSVGFSVLYLNSGDIEMTTINEPEGTGTSFSATSAAVGITVSRSLTDRFDLGVTVKYVQEKLFREKASTIAFDVGSQFRTGIYGMKLGMCLANFGGKMKLDGPDLSKNTKNEKTGITYNGGVRWKTVDWPIPLVFRLGISNDIIGEDSYIIKNPIHRLTLSLEANDPTDHYLRYNYGLEYEWNKVIALRVGYKANYDEADFTAGLGIDFSKIGINGRLDYAFNNYGILGYVHNYSFEFSF
ncbi:MAG: PorV/PorQ family protein [Calditrichaeota bacterium]|nr:PorV/PorQ family protein [Calditrichota bacterium]